MDKKTRKCTILKDILKKRDEDKSDDEILRELM
jgi:hypothetical protein